MDKRILELESKLQILESENEVLSSKSEENLLLSRAFSEINSINNLDNLFTNALESISILLNIPFAGIFEISKDVINSVYSYSLNCNDENPQVELFVKKNELLDQIFTKQQTLKVGEIELQMKDSSGVSFEPKVFFLIPLKPTFPNERVFVFADDDSKNINENKKALLVKIVNILISRIERIIYQDELERVNSELKSTLETLKKAQAQLVQKEKMASLGVLTAGVAHEINNPLNYILGAYTGLERIHTEKSYQEDSQEITVLLKSLKTGVERASHIVSGLNQFSRSNTSQIEDCNLHEIIENCLLILNNQLKYKIIVNKDYFPDTIIVKGNAGNLHQIFINLISNAEQAINDKGVIDIKTRLNQQKVHLSISDTGEGISEENLQKIADPFFTTKEPGKGTGLGLSIVYSIIRDLSGTIDFESTLGEGTIVRITLPIIK